MGLWTGTTPQAVAQDNYHYTFVVNGVNVADPLATTFSQERVGTQSTLEVSGADFQAYNPKVPHGVVSAVTPGSTGAATCWISCRASSDRRCLQVL